MRSLVWAARRLAVPLRPAGGLWRPLKAVAGAGVSTQQLAELREALAEAVESAEAVGPSAAQLLLETDPAARGPRQQYEQHYAEMALLKLHAALELAGHLRDAVGDDAGWRALLKQEKLALAVADAQLARDKASDFVAAVQRRAAANQIDCPD